METIPSPSLEEGTVIDDKWEILSHIATGGKGEVYLARQINLDRKVAFKIISSAFLESLEGDAEEIGAELERFRREVKIMAKMRHPNVLQVYDYGVVNQTGRDLHYIVMEYVPGPTLKMTMDEKGFGQDENAIQQWLRKYYLPILDGVEAVNAEDIVHRDLKPANVLLDEDIPKIADFGLAGGGGGDNITRSHHIIGTMPYMPEEQFMDLATTDVRADVYALGKILYEAVAGKLTKENSPPFKTVGVNDPHTAFMKDLDRIIRQATAYDRNERIPSVRTLHEALLCLLDKQCVLTETMYAPAASSRISPTAWVFLSGLLLALLAAGLLYHFWGMELSPSPAVRQKSETVAASPPDQDKETTAALQPFAQDMHGPDGALRALLTGLDGAAMRLVQADKANDLTFYMEETQVTNHLFVEFLRTAPDIAVKDNVVYGGDVLWLYLGEVQPGYEPILYLNGQFTLAAQTALNPVVRVTPQGAKAYARYYGRSLPTMRQWVTAKRLGEERQAQSSRLPSILRIRPVAMEHMGSSPPSPSQAPEPKAITRELFPVIEAKPNRFGIRGLGANVNEWVMEPLPGGAIKFHVHGGIGSDDYQAYLERNAWEAFANVGFRTVVAVPAEERL